MEFQGPMKGREWQGGGGVKRDRETKNHYSMTIDCCNGMPKTGSSNKVGEGG